MELDTIEDNMLVHDTLYKKDVCDALSVLYKNRVVSNVSTSFSKEKKLQ